MRKPRAKKPSIFGLINMEDEDASNNPLKVIENYRTIDLM